MPETSLRGPCAAHPRPLHSEVGAEHSRALHGGDAIGVQQLACEVAARESDLETTATFAQGFDEGTLGRWRHKRDRRDRGRKPRRALPQCRARSARPHARPAGLRSRRRDRDQWVVAARRFQADETTARCWKSDRPSAVIGMGKRHNAGCNCRGRAVARPAGRVRRVPRVARGCIKRWLGDRQQAEFRHVGLAERYQPGAARPGRELRVVASRLVGCEPASGARRRLGGSDAYSCKPSKPST
jgi:hypothetical protein